MSLNILCNRPSMFMVFCIISIFAHIITSPIPLDETAYGTFLSFLLKNNCTMPVEVEIPFPGTTKEPFDYLSTPLKECQTGDALNEHKEVYLLCKETFEVLQNITCSENRPLSKIQGAHVSEDICIDFKDIQTILPQESEYLARKLSDSVICKVFCSEERESLCNVLLWSHDIQAKIQSSLMPKLDGNEDKHDNEVVADEDVPNGTSNEHLPEIGNTIDDKVNENKKQQINPEFSFYNGSNFNKESLSSTGNNSDNALNSADNIKAVSHKNVTLGNKSPVKIPIPVTSKISPESEKTKEVNSNPEYKSGIHILRNDTDSKLQNKSPEKNPASKSKQNILKNEHDKLNKDANLVGSTNNTKSNKIVNSVNAIMHNEIKKLGKAQNTSEINIAGNEVSGELNYQEKGESKIKGSNDSNFPDLSKEKLNEDIQKDSNILTTENSQIPDLITTLHNSDKDNEGQEDKEQELYNDSENNDGDYSKSDFDNTYIQPPKNKDSDFKNSANIESDTSGNEMSNNYGFLSSRNNIGWVPDDSVQAKPTFPGQEDSHFFFYFLTIVFILMAGYLIFHNKQKIIALIVEGRHERRRRSHGAGYKKLETK